MQMLEDPFDFSFLYDAFRRIFCYFWIRFSDKNEDFLEDHKQLRRSLLEISDSWSVFQNVQATFQYVIYGFVFVWQKFRKNLKCLIRKLIFHNESVFNILFTVNSLFFPSAENVLKFNNLAHRSKVVTKFWLRTTSLHSSKFTHNQSMTISSFCKSGRNG